MTLSTPGSRFKLVGEVDQPAHGVVVGGHALRRRQHRRFDQRDDRLDLTGHQTTQERGRFPATFRHVNMWVGVVADQDVGRRHHAGGNVGMQIEGCHQGSFANDLPAPTPE